MRIIDRLRLAKVPLCLLIGSAVFFGALLADPVVSLRTLMAVGGVFFVATGAASLNSLQESVLDGTMGRTRNRPLPSGMLLPRQAGWQAFLLISGGLLLLAIQTADIMPVVLTALAVVLYNGIYTSVKKISILAIIPGAICGALPVYIGWLVGGGEYFSFTAILLFALFVLWQIPHFWLVLLHYQEEYVAGSLPNLLHHFHENTLRRFFVTWIGALAFVMLMFATLPYSLASVARFAVVVNALFLLVIFVFWMKRCSSNEYRLLFFALNSTLAVHMAILGVGRFLGR